MASSLRCTRVSTAKPAITRRSIACSATVDRRAAMGALLLPALMYVPKASALILDEEDEELVEKAKQNRKARIAQNKQVTRQLLQDDGIVNKSLDNDLVPVQKAVYQLASVGQALEKNDTGRASSIMNGRWVEDFESATLRVDTASTAALIEDVKGLRTQLASNSDIKATKGKFVSLVLDFQTWAVDSKFELKGL